MQNSKITISKLREKLKLHKFAVEKFCIALCVICYDSFVRFFFTFVTFHDAPQQFQCEHKFMCCERDGPRAIQLKTLKMWSEMWNTQKRSTGIIQGEKSIDSS